MKIVICLDEKNGYMFNNRRQSMDKGLRKHLLSRLEGKKLWMSEYSGSQFVEEGNYVVDDDYEEKAAKWDFCFIENKGYSFRECDEVWIFRWKRIYPYDKCFDVDLPAMGFVLESKEKFSGTSHEEITLEIYRRL